MSYEPTSPGGFEDALDLTLSPTGPQPLPEDIPIPNDCPSPPSDLLADPFTPPEAPGAAAPSATSMPAIPAGPLQLDPEVAKLYDPAGPGEDFLETRRRVDR